MLKSPSNFCSTPLLTDVLGGRRVSFRRLGGGSRKILFFHGFPGSSLQIEIFQASAAEFGLEIICFDRPGYGHSEAGPPCQYQATREICLDLLQKNGWQHFDVFTVSGGTPFGLDFAREHSRMVRSITILCGLPPLSSPETADLLPRLSLFGLRSLRYIPGLWLKILMKIVTKNSRGGRSRFLELLFPASDEDKRCLSRPDLRRSLYLGLNEAFRQSGKGPKRDAEAFFSEAELSLGAFHGNVAIWHGLDDLTLPAGMARILKERLGGAELHLVPGEGHLSLPVQKIGLVLENRYPPANI